MKSRRLLGYNLILLLFTLGVILWGAYVRATGSGAGCGSHWPLCDGEVIPRSPSIATLIEFTHRISSGLAFLMAIGLVVWTYLAFPKGSLARIGATLTLAFYIVEALIGAGLVAFNLVAENPSVVRALSNALHLANSYLLLAVLTLTGWWVSGRGKLRLVGMMSISPLFGMLGVLIIGMGGTVAALGDTLFPAQTLAEGLSRDFSATAHFLERLRWLHPAIALVVSIYLLIQARWIAAVSPLPRTKRMASILSILLLFQLAGGALNVALLAPVWMQLVHLLLSDLVWIALVLIAASILSKDIPDDRREFA